MADGSGSKAAAETARVERRGPLRPKRLSSARRRIESVALIKAIQIGDVLAFIGGSVASHLIVPTARLPLSIVIAPVLALAAMLALRAYDFGIAERLWRHHLKSALAIVLAGLGAQVLSTLVTQQALTPELALLWVVLAGALTFTFHALWLWRIRSWRRGGRLTPNVILVGATPAAEKLIQSALQSRSMNILGIFDDRKDRVGPSLMGVPVLGATADLVSHRILPYVDRVVLSLPLSASGRINEMLDRLAPIPNPIALLAHEADQGRAIQRLANVPLTSLTGTTRRTLDHALKRAFDFASSAVALFLLAPAFAAIALAIRLDSPGPIFFKQRRHGFLNEEVIVWKFRSMRVDMEDATASRQVTAGDDRITRVGGFLRRTSLDELPQLLNVLRGEMSVVGPRPHAIGMKAAGQDATKLATGYAHRHRIKPGITGWAAINGSRGAADTPEAIQRRVALDLEYIERQTFWLDLWIIALTVPRLLGDKDTVR